MAAIIQANLSLTQGRLAVLSRGYSADDNGQVVYTARYCCLSSFASANAARFRIGSAPPTPAPSSMSALRLFRAPALSDVKITTENGLTYFDATYNSETVGEYIVTESDTLTEFSASNTTGETIRTVSFKYYSKTIEVSAANTYLQAEIAKPGDPFDVRGGGVSYKVDTQISYSKTRSSRGGFSYNTRSTGLYVAA
jgi:hypothetical protein